MPREFKPVGPDLTRFFMRGARDVGKNLDQVAREMEMSSVTLSKVMRGEKVMAPEKYERLQSIVQVALSDRQKVVVNQRIEDFVKERKRRWQSQQP